MVGMVDVGDKPETLRVAVAQAIIKVESTTMDLIREGNSPKGNIVDAARLSATLAAKKTWELLPYCHPVDIDSIRVDITLQEKSIEVLVNVKNIAKTGVEMEAMTGACVGSFDNLRHVKARG